MPISVPNIIADPALLERFKPTAIIRDCSPSNLVAWYNVSGSTINAGEPIIHLNQVCISARRILPGKIGEVYTQWVADFIAGAGVAAAIVQNALVYWDYSAAGAINADGTTVAGSGAVKNSAPTNGFILGRAVLPAIQDEAQITLDGSSKPIVAAAAAAYVRVASVPVAPTTYGTIGTYA